ncbi:MULTISPECIES: iron-siderophore ABC transporter substrate-binding protein [Streptomyces]|uniref:Iron-siderophore ABC transporter substrate-binding protein n=1 Tax=Streptomyces evansiae TaxID=3075535 RepID=A0ABU2R2F2_9ACTN|nr:MULTISPECIES: iron-siderophore ABC transporter substrate-binding protein [unclassified Streptomyces]MDT0410878.1 iron-siderophore ABC transporter substrate-binding protein [Streptomyces sp. DSM 41979]MDT0420206.1 iron-siderophore ABC transporter substrate-binding protein [Streptomyces sp. DSM 41859]MYQ58028.1 ABC transporter substrate-binding protein [Streptomyces sp. SID4926]SCE46719.1 iron complex transport system substrate-binding protein [Streptomyces sp. DfronAA-171]
MRRLLLATAAAATAAMTLAACGSSEPAKDEPASKGSAAASKVSVTDDKGQKITLDGPAKRIVTTEWNVTEAALTLGVTPVGVADIKGYRAWDKAAPLGDGAKDIGMRGEPSTDTVAALHPDVIIATSDLKPAAIKQLRKIAPVLEATSATGGEQLKTVDRTLDLVAAATGTTDKATKVKKDFRDKIAEGRKALAAAGADKREIAFADGWATGNQVSVRPFTGDSFLGEINTELGLKNAWTLKGDKAYGLASTDVEGLTKLGDVNFVYIASDADGGDPFAKLAKNSVWKSLPFVKNDHVHRMDDGIWQFGNTASGTAYVDNLVKALTK